LRHTIKWSSQVAAGAKMMQAKPHISALPTHKVSLSM
jgi:hypothetical protein